MRSTKGNISTFSGIMFEPLAPRIEDIRITDIAHALSQKCRYTGHTLGFYSVAEHCVKGSQWFEAMEEPQPYYAEWFLLHDTGEAYLPDVARPIKASLTGFAEIEDRILKLIVEKYDLEWPMPKDVKWLDTQMCWAEIEQIMAPSIDNWRDEVVEAPEIEVLIECWLPERAELEYLRQFVRLFGP